jgi:hypothetical protein
MNCAPLTIDQYGSNLQHPTIAPTLQADLKGKGIQPAHDKEEGQATTTNTTAPTSATTSRQTTNQLLAELKGKGIMQTATKPALRRSQCTAKQTALFFGLVPTPSKAKPRHKTKVTPKA